MLGLLRQERGELRARVRHSAGPAREEWEQAERTWKRLCSALDDRRHDPDGPASAMRLLGLDLHHRYHRLRRSL